MNINSKKYLPIISKHKKFVVIALVLFIILTEFILRKKYGFCDAVLMQENSKFEYIAKPNQNRFRFGRHIYYNDWSMRSSPIDTTATLILGLGDSIINGGALTDQDSLATTMLSDTLTKKKSKKIQVLNISAGSWGPDNCAAYLFSNGDFSAKYAFLVVSSHDALDNMNFEKIVGKNPNYPDKQYKSAIVELFDRYLIPRFIDFFKKAPEYDLGINKNGTHFNKGFSLLNNYFKEKQIPFFIYLHAETSEQKNRRYNQLGELIIAYCEKDNVKLVEDLEILNLSDYRDNIHLNDEGQKKLFKIVYEQLKGQLNQF